MQAGERREGVSAGATHAARGGSVKKALALGLSFLVTMFAFGCGSSRPKTQEECFVEVRQNMIDGKYTSDDAARNALIACKSLPESKR